MNPEINDKLLARKIKPTAMRQLVLNLFTQRNSALSLPELEHLFSKVDKSTLFRTLKTFEDNKLIHRIDDGSGSVKYALCTESCQCNPEDLHVHFYCIKCNHTYCLNEIPVPTLSVPLHFTLESISIVVKGVCANCKR